MRSDMADTVYVRVRDLLEQYPEAFSATTDGLVVPLSIIDEHVIGHDITRSTAICAELRDRWLLRATCDYWVLLPEAFGIEDDELPAYVLDRRAEAASSKFEATQQASI